MIIFYDHEEADSIAAASLIYWSERDRGVTSIKTIPSDKFYRNIDVIKDGERVYIVGFCPALKEIKMLARFTGKLIWIDNSEVSQETIEHSGITVRASRRGKRNTRRRVYIGGMLETNDACTMLAWKYMCESMPSMRKKDAESGPPYFAKLMSAWYALSDEYGQDARMLYLGILSLDAPPSSIIWKDLRDNISFVNRVILDGCAVDSYTLKKVREEIFSKSYDAVFEGHKCIVLNSTLLDVTLMHDLKLEGYDFFVTHMYNGNEECVTIYTINEKLSALKAWGKFAPRGDKYKVSFKCSRDEFPIHEGAYRYGHFITESKKFPIKKAIRLMVNYEDNAFQISIPELHITRESPSFDTAKLAIEEDIRCIRKMVREGATAHEIDPMWTLDDAARAVKWLDEHIGRTMTSTRKQIINGEVEY